MTDTTPTPRVYKVPLKAGGVLEVQGADLLTLNDDVYAEILLQGLKALLNRGMDKAVGPVKELEGAKLDEAKANAVTQAQKNYDAMKSGSVKKTAAKGAKVSGAVNTEAMRLARNIIKDALKREGKKVSYYPASEITVSAKALLEANPSILETAKANIAARDAAATETSATLSGIVANTKASPELEKAAEKRKADRAKDKPLSASQAGKTKPHKPSNKPTLQANA